MVIQLIHPALQGKPVAWFAPNYRLLSDVWRILQSMLQPVIVGVNQQERRLELRGGGIIEMWSLDSPDSGRGRAYAVVVIDEAAMVPNLEQVWQQTIRPMLTDFLGEAWFLSTPKGMNYFKTLFDRGQDPTKGDWMSWQMPTSENPHIEPGEIEAARLDMTEAAFNQSIWHSLSTGKAASSAAWEKLPHSPREPFRKPAMSTSSAAIGDGRTTTRCTLCSMLPPRPS